jgi:hypothetical protein
MWLRLKLIILSLLICSDVVASGPTWEPGQTRFIPNFANDKPIGYLCVKVESGSIYEKVGLQKGDNVTEINGNSIVRPLEGAGGPDLVIDLFKEFEKDETGTILVERKKGLIRLRKPISNLSR